MTSKNPIECVSLMAHKEDVSVFIHRKNSMHNYVCYIHHEQRDRSTRFHRMMKLVTEFLKTTYLRNTGNLAPEKW